VFVVFGLMGFVWAAYWYWWFRDDPSEHRAVSPAELKLIVTQRSPGTVHKLTARAWARLVTSRSLLALCAMYFTQAFGFYFYITWLHTYLHEQRGFSEFRLGVVSGLPLIFSAPADLLGGLTTDWVTRHYGLRMGRCLVGGIALAVAGVAIIAGAATQSAIASALLIGLAGCAGNFLLGACWGVCIDIAGGHAGLISGCMNSAGQLGGALSPAILPYVAKSFGWAAGLYMIGVVYLVGSLFWWFVDPRVPIFEKGKGPPSSEPPESLTF
jgi:MFS family permease